MAVPFARSAKARKLLSQVGTGQAMRKFNLAFVQAAGQASRRAANDATNVSRNTFTSNLSGRPFAPPRPGRPTTSGQFVQYISWYVDSKTGAVRFDFPTLQAQAPYWPINEIGTNGSGTAYSHTAQGAVKAFTVYNIPSQRGRYISSGLVWASGLGAQANGPHRGIGNEQLFARATVLAQQVSLAKIRINREIKAKHFIRDGAKSGFAGYRKDMTRAFRQAYK